jgi:SSS family solute:Na+ symporter
MPWSSIDPIVIGVPLVFLITIVISLLTAKPENEHLDKVFKDVG